MPSPTVTCEVFTFKEGLLSAIAHDLRITVGGASIELGDGSDSVTARFDATSLRVACARRDGRDDPQALSAKQRREIEDNISRRVLDTRRHPTIEFESTAVTGEGDTRTIEGYLRLHGVRRPIQTTARRQDGRWSASVDLHQPDFGITPFSAMLGTLKIQPRVRVQVSVADPSAC